MNRRVFSGSLFAGLGIHGWYARPARAKPGEVPRRPFGKTGVKLSVIGQGGARLGYLRTIQEAAAHVRYAYSLGINYFDCARSYWEGHSEETYGAASPEFRKEIFLTTKSAKRTREGAEAELDQSLRAMKTDYIDLWQMHDVRSQKDVDTIFGAGGAIEAFESAKKKGKARFIGFTVHFDPEAGLKMLAAYDRWDTILMPLHAADTHYLSFEKNLLPAAVKKGVAIQAMKVFGNSALLRLLHARECLRYTLSLPVDAAVIGCSSAGQWDDDCRAVSPLAKLADADMQTIRERATANVPQAIKGPGLEYWKRQDAR